MRQIVKHRQCQADLWSMPGEEPAAAGVVLSLADYLAVQAGTLPSPVGAGAALGVQLEPADDEAQLAPFAAHLPLVVVNFPKSTEGRGYTQGRMLRERHGFGGELRARGAVLLDQVFLLARCGSDAFEMAEGQNLTLAAAELDRFSVAYQTAVGTVVQPLRRGQSA
jgi:uncharacterized protein (DUF934 family)